MKLEIMVSNNGIAPLKRLARLNIGAFSALFGGQLIDVAIVDLRSNF